MVAEVTTTRISGRRRQAALIKPESSYRQRCGIRECIRELIRDVLEVVIEHTRVVVLYVFMGGEVVDDRPP